MSSVPVVWQHGYLGTGSLLPASEACQQQSLLAASGRVLAVAGALAVDLFDTSDVADLSGVLGPGRCKMHFIASFPVMDIADPVAVRSLCFLRGGLLALAGTCSRGAGARASPSRPCARAQRKRLTPPPPPTRSTRPTPQSSTPTACPLPPP